MRKLTTLCLAAALCLLALPVLADGPDLQDPPVADAATTVEELFVAADAEAATPAATPAMAVTPEPLFTAGEPCGGVTCPKGTYCCNPTCNMCVLPGMSCTQQVCN